MFHALLRIGRNKAAWEGTDVAQILKTDFRLREGGWDLRPSVYEIEAPDRAVLQALIIRVHAEHTASFLEPPRKGVPNFDLHGTAGALDSNPGQTEFEFANRCHRELVMVDDVELRELVEELMKYRAKRELTVSYQQMLQYVASVRATAEWQSAAARNPKVSKWLKVAIKSLSAER